MSLLVISNMFLWLAILVFGVLVLALSRQVGLLHERIAPAGALALRGPIKVGAPAPQFTLPTLSGDEVSIGHPGRSQLIFFLSPDCAVCRSLLPVLVSAALAERRWLDLVLASDGAPLVHQAYVKKQGVAHFPYVLSEDLGRSYGVSKLPYAVLIDEAGKVASFGLVNTREHVESLFEAKERKVADLQEYFRSANHYN